MAQINFKQIAYSNAVIVVLILLAILVFTFTGIIHSIVFSQLYFDTISVISVASLILFIITCYLGLSSSKLFFFFLIIHLIAFPSAVDNFFPGVYLGDMNEIGASIFPFLTHIDVYILLGIVKASVKRNNLKPVSNKLFFVSIIVLLSSSLINIFYSVASLDFLLIIVGFFHLRYLILLYLLFSLYDVNKYQKEIVSGLVISVFILFAEALVYSYLKHYSRLVSGTLGTNTYANIIAAITVFLIFYYKNSKVHISRITLLLCIATGILTVLLTTTRMALLSGIFLYLLASYYYNNKLFYKMLKIVFTFIAVIALLYVSGSHKKLLPKRYDISYLASKIHINPNGNLNEFIKIESSWETNSLKTRLKLFYASFNMTKDSPFFGIGSMRWNYYKNKYGFDEKILLDSHNGYLAVISQFGVFSVFFIYLIFFYPFRIFRKNISVLETSPLFGLFIINLGMAIADFSNAGIYKHQIFALLCFNVLFLIFYRKENGILKPSLEKE